MVTTRLFLSGCLLHNKPRRDCQDNHDDVRDLIGTAGFVIYKTIRDKELFLYCNDSK